MIIATILLIVLIAVMIAIITLSIPSFQFILTIAMTTTVTIFKPYLRSMLARS